MQVKEIMSDNVEYIDPELMLTDAAGKMKNLNVGVLPVGENDRLVGMLNDRDIAVRAVADGRDPKNTKVRDAMTSPNLCAELKNILTLRSYDNSDKIIAASATKRC